MLQIGGMLPENVQGQVEGCSEGTTPEEIKIQVLDGQDQFTTTVPLAMLLEALAMEPESTIHDIRELLPVFVRVKMNVNDDVEDITVLSDKP